MALQTFIFNNNCKLLKTLFIKKLFNFVFIDIYNVFKFFVYNVYNYRCNTVRSTKTAAIGNNNT